MAKKDRLKKGSKIYTKDQEIEIIECFKIFNQREFIVKINGVKQDELYKEKYLLGIKDV